ncbi:DUF302 domain-containing protein [Phycicoccus sp. MAQZ13P-2]|uniref:DUF302 domain-containing protein n=1 Tax=Phycicoccus mangrovi TaxID=2840470 RepID=UPI001C003B14|nr:DUF302 domain-containing protein [Phycicoccus mangrovi]MBT9254608.1 DUF302 domain-containing protein [Phycicoccus mangrovi]MBT9273187.1 DUF302 domain-containing protein [Phycicoccus mangrovi]
MPYALSVLTDRPFEDALTRTRAALEEYGFGVLTEIDIAETLAAKTGATIPAQVILGACRPPLALDALRTEPGIGLLLPCNVVVRESDDRVLVEAMDPEVMVQVTGNEELHGVADDARARLEAALTSITA